MALGSPLAARNHGLLLEALRQDVTPVGTHYLLTPYDVPFLDPASWRLEVAGAVERRCGFRSRRSESVGGTRRVTMECAGNGRARLSPRPVSQPWLLDAVGTAEWTGTPSAALLREDVLLVWGMNGAALPPQHSAPVRLLVPGWYGIAQANNLVQRLPVHVVES